MAAFLSTFEFESSDSVDDNSLCDMESSRAYFTFTFFFCNVVNANWAELKSNKIKIVIYESHTITCKHSTRTWCPHRWRTHNFSSMAADWNGSHCQILCTWSKRHRCPVRRPNSWSPIFALARDPCWPQMAWPKKKLQKKWMNEFIDGTQFLFFFLSLSRYHDVHVVRTLRDEIFIAMATSRLRFNISRRMCCCCCCVNYCTALTRSPCAREFWIRMISNFKYPNNSSSHFIHSFIDSVQYQLNILTSRNLLVF